MNAGSRVRTPEGDGTIITLTNDTEWTFGKPYRRAWIIVALDSGGHRLCSAHDIEELDEIEWPE